MRRTIASFLVATLTASNFIFGKFHAAERIEFHFEDMTIPIEIDQLIFWNQKLNQDMQNYQIDQIEDKEVIELGFWLNILGFESRSALSGFLSNPLFKDRSMERQLLRSWSGRKLLDEISDLVVIDQDKKGIMIFNTLEKLLDDQKQVSLLDLMQALPADVIQINLDELVKVLTNWRKELEKQEKLITDLRKLPSREILLETNAIFNKELNDPSIKKIKIKSLYRADDIEIEIWSPPSQSKKAIRNEWILFMPGLGSDPKHFHWLSKSLSQNGWEIVLINHQGSNTKAMNLLVQGKDPFPSGIELFPYRLEDLKAVLEEKERGLLNIKAKNVVLMGHSLGALNAFLASGAIVEKGLMERCNKALNDFSITNISRLLQCQLNDVPVTSEKEIPSLSAIVGINSFGKLLWPQSMGDKINVPILLTGGTFDLITPPLSEQLGLLISTNENMLSRTLIIEGASHFSPISIEIEEGEAKGSDVYQISDSLVGANPASVQVLLAQNIMEFLESLGTKRAMPVFSNQNSNVNLKFHILDHSKIYKLFKN